MAAAAPTPLDDFVMVDAGDAELDTPAARRVNEVDEFEELDCEEIEMVDARESESPTPTPHDASCEGRLPVKKKDEPLPAFRPILIVLFGFALLRMVVESVVLATYTTAPLAVHGASRPHASPAADLSRISLSPRRGPAAGAVAASAAGLASSAALAAAALCVLIVLCWALDARSSSPAPGKGPTPGSVETDASRSLPEPADAQLGVDLEAFQASMERECDLVLSRLCDAAVDGQVLRSLAEDLGSQAAMDTEPPTLHDGGPALHFEALQASEGDSEIFWADFEQHCDLAFEATIGLAFDGQCDIVLKMLQDECAYPSALEDDTMEGVFDLTGTQGTLSGHVEDDSTEQGRSLRTTGAFDKALQEYHEQLSCEAETVERPVRRMSLHEMIMQHIHRIYSSYLLLAI